MKKLILAVILALFVGTAYASTGAVLDNNNGGSGSILVNSGSDFLGQDVGTWTSPVDVPELKGETGDTGETGATGEQGTQGEVGLTGDDGRDGKDGDDYDNSFLYGAGLDLTWWQNPTKSVAFSTQYKYDFHNNGQSIFGVVSVNLWDMFSRRSE